VYYKVNLHNTQEGGNKMNLSKLKGKLKEKNKTYKDGAERIGQSVTCFSNKMNGHSSFDVYEAALLAEWLEMDEKERLDIFFN
jgi:cyanate lyase